jgi:hypothetical protein
VHLHVLGLQRLVRSFIHYSPKHKLRSRCAFVLTSSFADDDAPLPQKSRVTAFIITDSGPVVECWEVGSLLPGEDEGSTQRHGSKERPRLMKMDDEGMLAGVDILTWPAYAPLYPPAIYSSQLDFGSDPSYVVLLSLLALRIDTSPR